MNTACQPKPSATASTISLWACSSVRWWPACGQPQQARIAPQTGQCSQHAPSVNRQALEHFSADAPEHDVRPRQRDGKAQRVGQGHWFAVYYCDPHSPWQRCSCENMNGLVRQYLLKGTDLAGYSKEQLYAIADEINNRPRKGLRKRSPLAVYTELLLNSHTTQHLPIETRVLHFTFEYAIFHC